MGAGVSAVFGGCSAELLKNATIRCQKVGLGFGVTGVVAPWVVRLRRPRRDRRPE